MGQFTSYYDTSRHGKMARRAMATAGIVASERQYVRFATEWDAALKCAGIPHLHMKKLPAMFKGRENDKHIFLNRVVDLLRKRVTKTFGAVLDLDAYDRLNEEFELDDNGRISPFALTAGACAFMADRWTKRTHPGQPVLHYHESGDLGIGTAQAFCRINGVELNCLPKVNEAGEWFVPFQATDFLAWEVRRGYEQLHSGPTEYRFRPAIEKLAKELKIEFHVWTERSLRADCLAKRVPRRKKP